jgi:hypothetical protein
MEGARPALESPPVFGRPVDATDDADDSIGSDGAALMTGKRWREASVFGDGTVIAKAKVLVVTQRDWKLLATRAGARASPGVDDAEIGDARWRRNFLAIDVKHRLNDFHGVARHSDKPLDVPLVMRWSANDDQVAAPENDALMADDLIVVGNRWKHRRTLLAASHCDVIVHDIRQVLRGAKEDRKCDQKDPGDITNDRAIQQISDEATAAQVSINDARNRRADAYWDEQHQRRRQNRKPQCRKQEAAEGHENCRPSEPTEEARNNDVPEPRTE